MDKIIANYTTQPDNSFPLDCETMKYVEDNRAMAEMLGNIAGDKVILAGCTLQNSGTQRSAGYVFVKTVDYPQGEVLYFTGGSVQNGMYLKKEPMAVTANSVNYDEAYTIRSLAPGLGDENFAWDDFVDISDRTNRQLRADLDNLNAKVSALQPAPVGTILIWPSDTVPENYHLCDGASLDKNEYPELFSVIGGIYGMGGESVFKLPDMRGRFVAGRGTTSSNNYYPSVGFKGGANKVTLKSSESGLPAHSHGYTGLFKHIGTNGGGDEVVFDKVGGSGNNGLRPANFFISDCAGQAASQAHENRPPFIVMNYIIRIK